MHNFIRAIGMAAITIAVIDDLRFFNYENAKM